MGRGSVLHDELAAALEAAIRQELARSEDPEAFVRQLADELQRVLTSPQFEGADQVSQIAFRATLAAAVSDVLGGLTNDAK